MLPKPEKTKKGSSDSEVNEISDADKTRKKRLILILIISFTIGLSVIFSVYNFLKDFKFSLPALNSSFVTVPQAELESELKSILKSDYLKYSFTAQTNSPDPYFWSTNPNSSPQDFPTLASTIEQHHQPLDPSITSVLPQGLKIFQYKIDNRYQFIIITPENQIYIDIQNNSGNSTLIDLIPAMYWYLVKR